MDKTTLIPAEGPHTHTPASRWHVVAMLQQAPRVRLLRTLKRLRWRNPPQCRPRAVAAAAVAELGTVGAMLDPSDIAGLQARSNN